MKFNYRKRTSGFLLMEVLIAALILSASVSVSMYLFRMGFQYLQSLQENTIVLAKLPQALSFLQVGADLSQPSGETLLSEGVILSWNSTLVKKSIQELEPANQTGADTQRIQPYELYLYRVDFTLSGSNHYRNYSTYILRYKALFRHGDVSF